MKLIVVTPEGDETTLEWPEGQSVMVTIREADLDIFALCGGGCSCGTCHVHVDPSWVDKLINIKKDEYELVSVSPYYNVAVSRLGCQLKASASLDGLKVTIQDDAWGG